MKFQIYLIGNKIFSNSQKAISIQNLKKLGELKQGKIIYSPYEAFYLFETGNAEIIYNNKLISEDKLIKILSKKDKEFYAKYIVFRDLRKKGYIVKTGSKFGEEFRVYCCPKNQKDSLIPAHAKWIVYPARESEKIHWKDFIAKNRIAHATAKKLLIAIVDSEEDIIYYEVNWMKI